MSEFRLRGDEGFYDLLGLMRAWAGMWERSGVSRREAFEVALDALDKLGLPSSHPLVSEPDLPDMWEEADLSGGATDQEASKPETIQFTKAPCLRCGKLTIKHICTDCDEKEAGKAVPVADGIVVPAEPTTAMVNAGQCGCMDNDVTVSVYKAMLAVAPSQPEPTSKGVAPSSTWQDVEAEQAASQQRALSDAEIDNIAMQLFNHIDNQGMPLAQDWCEEVGRPFARAILAAASGSKGGGE